MNSTMLAPDYHDQPDQSFLEPATSPTYPPLVIERFLRDRDAVWRQIGQDHHLSRLIRQMLVSSAVSLACYGLVIGISHSLLQALASAVKLPFLFLLTLLICLPTLYLFNLLFGGRLSVRQVLALGLSATTVSSALTLAFAPIALFFLVTAQSYSFFVLLNVVILGLTGMAGLRFLTDGTRAINVQEEMAGSSPPPTATISAGLIQAWLVLYGFVGTQLAWTLRPFFGMAGEPFMLFHPVEGNFYFEVLRLLFEMLFLGG